MISVVLFVALAALFSFLVRLISLEEVLVDGVVVASLSVAITGDAVAVVTELATVVSVVSASVYVVDCVAVIFADREYLRISVALVVNFPVLVTVLNGLPVAEVVLVDIVDLAVA